MKRWIFKRARWWQFWMPGSGLKGGMLAGAVVLLAYRLLKLSVG